MRSLIVLLSCLIACGSTPFGAAPAAPAAEQPEAGPSISQVSGVSGVAQYATAPDEAFDPCTTATCAPDPFAKLTDQDLVDVQRVAETMLGGHDLSPAERKGIERTLTLIQAEQDSRATEAMP